MSDNTTPVSDANAFLPEFQDSDWKSFKRHPISAEYPDLPPRAFAEMVAGIKAHGVVGRKITLHDGMILDGFQLFSACVKADMKPEFEPLPKGMSPEDFVSMKNDIRRHETAEQAQRRIDERRNRVAEAVRAGQSKSAIAANEGVSRPTIDKDLLAIQDATGCNLTAKDGQRYVTGRDGKTYPAKPPKKESQTKDQPKAAQPNAKQRAINDALVTVEKLVAKPWGQMSPLSVRVSVGALRDIIEQQLPILSQEPDKPEPAPEPIRCERCVRVGSDGDQCPTCLAMREGRRLPKAGRIAYDDKRIEQAFGVLIREVDERARLMGKGVHHDRCVALLGEFLEAYKVWKGGGPAEPPEPAKKSAAFVKPTVEEVQAYCQERKNAVNAEAFVAFYASKGWRVGDQPMRDWRAAVITWEKRTVKEATDRTAGSVGPGRVAVDQTALDQHAERRRRQAAEFAAYEAANPSPVFAS